MLLVRINALGAQQAQKAIDPLAIGLGLLFGDFSPLEIGLGLLFGAFSPLTFSLGLLFGGFSPLTFSLGLLFGRFGAIALPLQGRGAIAQVLFLQNLDDRRIENLLNG